MLADVGIDPGYELARLRGPLSTERATHDPGDRRGPPGSQWDWVNAHRFSTLIPREHPYYLLANSGQINPQAHQHLSANALSLSHKPEENVLGSDIAMTQLQGFAH
jgi:hypothetical protein